VAVYYTIIFVEYLRAHIDEQSAMHVVNDGTKSVVSEHRRTKLIWESVMQLPRLETVGLEKKGQ